MGHPEFYYHLDGEARVAHAAEGVEDQGGVEEEVIPINKCH